jgi:hypothetical protein
LSTTTFPITLILPPASLNLFFLSHPSPEKDSISYVEEAEEGASRVLIRGSLKIESVEVNERYLGIS